MRYGPCMCGDLCCYSCGPAQGNHQCPLCGTWASDCCEHLDEETGKIKPEHQAEYERIVAQQRAEEEEYAKQYEADRALAEKFGRDFLL